MAVDNPEDLIGATIALMDWFRSQGILPHEAILVVQMFIAELCVANEHCSPIDKKLEHTITSIRELIEFQKAMGKMH
jgi:hypothetical protein